MTDTRNRQVVDDLITLLETQRSRGINRVYLTPAVQNVLEQIPPDTANTADAQANQSPPKRLREEPPKNTQTAPREDADSESAAEPTVHTHADADNMPGPADDRPGTDKLAPFDTWEELAAAVTECTRCRLCEQRTNTVFGEGNRRADLMFVGEGPGEQEDLTGRPFVGRAGELLTKMIGAMQFTREDVYIANVVKCRPPGNRNPRDDEAVTCLPYLNRQIDLLQPKVIVLLGGVALRHILGLGGITKVRGRWHAYRGCAVMPTYHPSFLLRSPNRKREAWDDLKLVMERLGKDPANTKTT